MTTTLALIPGQTTLDQLERVYREEVQIQLDPGCKTQVDAAAKIVADAAAGDAAVYGINTGFGKLANTRIPADQTELLQKNLILSHCCGVGEPLEDSMVRLIMVLK